MESDMTTKYPDLDVEHLMEIVETAAKAVLKTQRPGLYEATKHSDVASLLPALIIAAALDRVANAIHATVRE